MIAESASFKPPRVVTGGFSGTAGFSVFELGVQKGSTQTAWIQARPRSVAESLVHIGDAIEWRKDTSCARVQVVKPFMRDKRVTQVFSSLAATHPWSRVLSSDASAGFCQVTVRAAVGAAVH